MKAILLLDMPKDCDDCDFSEWRKDMDWGDGDYCQINGIQCSNNHRSNHCPLRKLPEKDMDYGSIPIEQMWDADEQTAWWNGWNACVDKLQN